MKRFYSFLSSQFDAPTGAEQASQEEKTMSDEVDKESLALRNSFSVVKDRTLD